MSPLTRRAVNVGLVPIAGQERNAEAGDHRSSQNSLLTMYLIGTTLTALIHQGQADRQPCALDAGVRITLARHAPRNCQQLMEP